MSYPLDGSITKMGLQSAEAALLTPKAKKVTKQQLLILNDVARTHAGKNAADITKAFDQRTGLTLTVEDVASIGHAFDHMNARRVKTNTHLLEGTSCCCTCTPCCSCTASVVVESRI